SLVSCNDQIKRLRPGILVAFLNKKGLTAMKSAVKRQVQIPSDTVLLDGELNILEQAVGIVLFAHGSGSSRHSPRNQYVARSIREAGIGTLLFDLLTREEESIDTITRHLRFDIELLARRLVDATEWVAAQESTKRLRPGYFGASTGGGAA